MGLTQSSTGLGIAGEKFILEKENEDDRVIALAGNPNVGKSTVFNALTGLNQHTGNWPGKTVTNAQGKYRFANRSYIMVDLPGTYSLMAHSAEEEVARDFICFGGSDAVVVVCDATCLERNLNLVLQTIEITRNVVVCVNLMDEAKKKRIRIDLAALEDFLGVPVVGVCARSKKGLDALMKQVERLPDYVKTHQPVQIRYIKAIEDAIAIIQPVIEPIFGKSISARWLAIKLLDYDQTLCTAVSAFLNTDWMKNPELQDALSRAEDVLQEADIPKQELRDRIVSCIVLMAEEACMETVTYENGEYNRRDRKLDRLLTSRMTGIPIMLALLCVIFWITITGANVPSQVLSNVLFWFQDQLTVFFHWMGTPEWVHGVLVLGVYRVLAWVVSVMLPPMAIFFPLFTLLEDFGYLPRVAFVLDHHFKKASACGKQALTMCMGFGCNAAGVIGCRIIDSPRERLIAILTNNFVPCNGRFAPPYKEQQNAPE